MIWLLTHALTLSHLPVVLAVAITVSDGVVLDKKTDSQHKHRRQNVAEEMKEQRPDVVVLHVATCMNMHVCVCVCLCVSVFLSVFLSVCLSVCLSV